MTGRSARGRHWLWLIAVAVAFLPMAASADDWPMFRGNAERSGESQDAGVAPIAAPWTYTTGGPIRSSPAVADGRVFFGSDDGNVYALDALSGKLLWQYQTGGPVLSSPAVAEGWVFIGGPFGFYQIAVTGGQITALVEKDGVDTSPVVAGGRVFFVTRGGTLWGFGYTAYTAGQWQFNLPAPTTSSPVVVDNVVYVIVEDQLIAVSAEKGESLQPRLPMGATAGASTPALYERTLYFVGADDGLVRAVKLDTGEICTNDGQANPAMRNSSPAVSKFGVVVAEEDFEVHAYDLGSWSHCVVAASAAASRSNPSTDLVGMKQRRLTRSVAALLPVVGTEATPVSSPAIVGTVVVAGTAKGNVFIWDRATGTTKDVEINKSGAAIESSPAIAIGFSFVGCDDGNLYAFPLAFAEPTP